MEWNQRDRRSAWMPRREAACRTNRRPTRRRPGWEGQARPRCCRARSWCNRLGDSGRMRGALAGRRSPAPGGRPWSWTRPSPCARRSGWANLRAILPRCWRQPVPPARPDRVAARGSQRGRASSAGIYVSGSWRMCPASRSPRRLRDANARHPLPATRSTAPESPPAPGPSTSASHPPSARRYAGPLRPRPHGSRGRAEVPA